MQVPTISPARSLERPKKWKPQDCTKSWSSGGAEKGRGVVKEVHPPLPLLQDVPFPEKLTFTEGPHTEEGDEATILDLVSQDTGRQIETFDADLKIFHWKNQKDVQVLEF